MELRKAFEDAPDLIVVYVLPDSQWNEKSARFVDSLGMRERILFALDPGSAAADRLGVRKQETEPIEAGVPHPSTYLLDRDGIVRFADVRRDYHIWLDSDFLRKALDAIP